VEFGTVYIPERETVKQVLDGVDAELFPECLTLCRANAFDIFYRCVEDADW
jgi:hypothetical protein